MKPWDGTSTDTGWITLGIDSGNDAVAGATAAVRLINDVIYMRGKIEKTTGSWAASSTVTLVSGGNALTSLMRPSFRRDFQAAGNAASSDMKLLVNTDGSIQIVTGATVASYVALDGISYAN